ncbi:prolipoprotein diacylglyceryl transferase [Schaalia naturae]|uniref:Phosphatidylglycerol--prolipoprotein diacylglyceryl transferase n=1 Tax=Schaalia naturae TaxID=635203 RepID=A0ABW2SL10_9ACTO
MTGPIAAVVAAAIPSPPRGVWHLGPIPLRAYGILIVIGMIVAVWWTARRYAERGGDGEILYDVALWAIPLGIVGARLYHVVTSPDQYFGEGGNPVEILEIWKGGLGIWGGVAVGAVGAWIAMRRAHQRFGPLADSIAPALLVAQAIGRWGNYFNQELFGAPTTLPWGLRIDDAHLPAGYPSGTLFHPTFLYECLWNLLMAALIVWVDRRRTFRAGQVFALYLMAYTAGRVWIEMLRIDTAQHVLGLRLNVWTSIAVFLLGLVLFLVAGRVGAPTRLTPAEHEAAMERRASRAVQSSGPDAAPPQTPLPRLRDEPDTAGEASGDR